jgi:hypothetical protein
LCLTRDAHVLSSAYVLHYCPRGLHYTSSCQLSNSISATGGHFCDRQSLQLSTASNHILQLQSCCSGVWVSSRVRYPANPFSTRPKYQTKQNTAMTKYPIWCCLVSILAQNDQNSKAEQVDEPPC